MSTYFGVYYRNTAPSGCIPSYEVAVSLKENTRTDKDDILIGAICATEEEVDYWVDKLIVDLNAVRQASKRKLRSGKPRP